MTMAAGVIRAAVASPLIAHNAQNARRTGLQHINNNHPGATAKDPQPTIFGAALQMSWPVIGRPRISCGHLRHPASAAVPVVASSHCLAQACDQVRKALLRRGFALEYTTRRAFRSSSWSRTSSMPAVSGRPPFPCSSARGADGALEGTPGNKPGIGPGDGVMVAGDVRTLARDFCASGTAAGGPAPARAAPPGRAASRSTSSNRAAARPAVRRAQRPALNSGSARRASSTSTVAGSPRATPTSSGHPCA